MICATHRILFGGHIEKNELGRVFGMHRGEESRIQGFVGEILGKETTCETQG
jgi:hypothetical protein